MKISKTTMRLLEHYVYCRNEYEAMPNSFEHLAELKDATDEFFARIVKLEADSAELRRLRKATK